MGGVPQGYSWRTRVVINTVCKPFWGFWYPLQKRANRTNRCYFVWGDWGMCETLVLGIERNFMNSMSVFLLNSFKAPLTCTFFPWLLNCLDLPRFRINKKLLTEVRPQNLAITIVLLARNYRKPEMTGAIFFLTNNIISW